jgi:hypothetical protein
MIPGDITFDANATPPQWTDNGEQVIEKGTNIRIKIKGLRSEVDKMFAVGTMKEVSCSAFRHLRTSLTAAPGLPWTITIIVQLRAIRFEGNTFENSERKKRKS